MEQELFNGLKEALEIEDREIKLTDNFRQFKEWDSLGQLTVIAMLDERFQVAIETKQLNKLNTVGDLLNEIKTQSK